MKPQHKFEDFVSDCTNGISKVFITRSAMQTARSDFNLNTQKQVFEFIGNIGIEKPRFINSKPWENNSDNTVEIMVDAYAFYSGLIYGYIAFFHQPKTNKWIIKSFKKNQEPDTRNLVLGKALNQLLNRS